MAASDDSFETMPSSSMADHTHLAPTPVWAPSCVQIVTPRTRLHPVSSRHVTPTYVSWLNDPEVSRFLESRFVEQTLGSVTDFVSTMAQDQDVLFLAIERADDGQHIGNIKVGPVNWRHSTAEVGILLGDKSTWGLGYASEVITAVSTYALDRASLVKLTAGAYAANVGSVKAFERAGYEIEGRRIAQVVTTGGRDDVVLLGRVRGGRER